MKSPFSGNFIDAPGRGNRRQYPFARELDADEGKDTQENSLSNSSLTLR